MQHFPFCRHFQFCLSSASAVRVYIWQKWVLKSLLTVKCQFWWAGPGERGGEQRWWQWRWTWIFSSNLIGTWPSRSVSTLFTLISQSQWNNDISSCSPQKLQHYNTGTDIYACCFGFQARTVWPERFHLWSLQKWVDKRDWLLNLVLCFRSSPSVKHSLCSWQLG